MKPRIIATALSGALAVLALPSASAAETAYRVLRSFGVKTDAQSPSDSVLAVPGGKLVGVAAKGGANMKGTVFVVDQASGKEKQLYSFGVSASAIAKQTYVSGPNFDNWNPPPDYPLARDVLGDLIGVTRRGGTHNLGTVFMIDHENGKLTVLYSFTGGVKDGATPNSPLVPGPKAKTLYGTTEGGGKHRSGTVYLINRMGGAPIILYSFTKLATAAPPYFSVYKPVGRLAVNNNGAVFGTTSRGGKNGLGTVYELNKPRNLAYEQYNISVLHSFTGGNDGTDPVGGVVLNATQTTLYGVTKRGGSADRGTVYAYSARDKLRVVHSFLGRDGGDGSYPTSGLFVDKADMLYGTTRSGGPLGKGTVFALDPSTGNEIVLHEFGGQANGDGQSPNGTLIITSGGDLVGTTISGGVNDTGTIFALPR
jgi:uncharacterized repeat protein (TIGR03803 family)